jgi:cytochrome c peroxidase
LRNAPSLYNVAYRRVLFLDGRETRLAEQIWAPLLAANEMGNSSREQVLAKLTRIDGYPQAFASVFADGLTASNLGAALAAYQTALLSANSAFDRWYYGGEMAALGSSAKRGFALFIEHGCADCHQFDRRGAQFTDDTFHNTGVGLASQHLQQRQPNTLQLAPGVFVALNTPIDLPDRADFGRAEVTGNADDRWRFRTPSLRNVALTGPYMHDGSINSLESVIAFYNNGGSSDPTADQRVQPLGLNTVEQQALVNFLRALTSDNVDELATDARTVAVGDRQSGEAESQQRQPEPAAVANDPSR